MTTADATLIGVLNELLAVGHDRVEAYELARRESLDSELRSLFEELASRSRRFTNELTDEILYLGGVPTSVPIMEDRSLRTRMDLAAALSQHDRRAILSACAAGESAALRSYRQALDSDADLMVRELIEAQFIYVRRDHERIRKLRETTSTALVVAEPARRLNFFRLTL
jgi:uncharacterized protein (TIGR02284 family)